MAEQTGEGKSRRTETGPARKEQKRKQVMVLFILSAEQMLREGGVRNVTIRKIGDVTGYSSAALYSYFADVDELILYASVRYCKACLRDMAREITADMTSLARYRMSYEIFNRYAFQEPEIYLNLYFGRHSGKIGAVLDQYYQLFPEELTAPAALIRNLLREGRMNCDRYAARKLAEDGYIAADHADMVAELLVHIQEAFLHARSVNLQEDEEKRNEAFMRIFDHLIATN